MFVNRHTYIHTYIYLNKYAFASFLQHLLTFSFRTDLLYCIGNTVVSGGCMVV